MELLTRFVLGGIFVALFALIGESVKPKTFAGLFGAAPSIALAGLILVCFTKGEHSAMIETPRAALGSSDQSSFGRSSLNSEILWR